MLQQVMLVLLEILNLYSYIRTWYNKYDYTNVRCQNDSTPLIVFSGNVQLFMGTNAFQEAPAVDLTKHITKWSYCVKNINELNNVLDDAFIISQKGKG